MRLLITLFVFFTFATPAWSADFYKWTDDKGVVHFTDDPLLAPEKSKIKTIEGEPNKPARSEAYKKIDREIKAIDKRLEKSRAKSEKIIKSLRDSLEETEATEKQTIRAAEKTLTTIMNLWKDEKFKDLYEYGMLSSQSTYSKEAFVTSMEKKLWGLDCCGHTIKILSSKSDSDTLVYVRAKIGYKKKNFGARTEYVTETYQLSFDYGKWRISLFNLLYAP